MKFSRIGKHTIRCVISEEEISDLGYTMDEIMSNGERTQEFMNQIFDLAEQQFETKFELGIKTVRADFMSDHTLSLTFSEHPGAENMMEHLKDIVNSLLNSIPQQKWEELQAASKDKEGDEEVRVIVTLVFADLNTLIRFCRQAQISQPVFNALYKYRNEYLLVVDLSTMPEDEVRRLSSLTDEYATDLLIWAERKAHIEEYGELILKERAIETLRQL